MWSCLAVRLAITGYEDDELDELEGEAGAATDAWYSLARLENAYLSSARLMPQRLCNSANAAKGIRRPSGELESSCRAPFSQSIGHNNTSSMLTISVLR